MILRTRSARFFRRRVLRDTRGTAVVEFAIIFPILAMLVFGVIDFGRAFFLRNNLVSAVREGARYGATMADPCATASQALIRQRVQTSFGSTVTPTVDTSVGACSPAAGVVTDVVVRITSYTFTPVTPVFRLINYQGGLTISVSARYRWEASN